MTAKVRKQIVVLQRFGRRDHSEHVRDAVSSMTHCLTMVPDATTRDEVMGLEGAAAAAYFSAYGELFPADLRFSRRSRQPPMDVANSSLSFLYTVLLGECVTACISAGLDPAFGTLHADQDTRPALALDLMEEFRPMVVDQVVLESARQGRLKISHGRVEEGRSGVMLTKTGRQTILDAYERRMLTKTRGAIPDFAGTLRRHIYRQAQRLAGVLNGQENTFTGLSWR